MFTFPTKKKNPERRERWKQLIGRQDGKTLWSPSKDSRVCSDHFPEKEPTVQNPLPTLNLGYDDAEKRIKRINHFHNPEPKRPKFTVLDNDLSPKKDENIVLHIEDPEIETLTHDCSVPWIVTFLALFLSLFLRLSEYKKKVNKLNAEIRTLKMEIHRLKGVVYTEKLLKSDNDVAFYTGIPNKNLFEKLHSFVSPYVNRRWTGVGSILKDVRKFKKSPSRFGPNRKMTSKSEFLMMLMKLRLGLLSKDLAKRFDISETLCSRIFLSWLRACSILFKPLLNFPTHEALVGSKPERFRSLPDLHSIIDCTELFIETPKDLYLHGVTISTTTQ